MWPVYEGESTTDWEGLLGDESLRRKIEIAREWDADARLWLMITLTLRPA